MRQRFSYINTKVFIKKSKHLKRKRKDFEREIKDIVFNSLLEKDKNKELVDKNVSLLAELESMRKEKLDLLKECQQIMFKQNPNQMVIKNDFRLLLESLKSDRKEMIQLFQTAYGFVNKMIDKIGDKIEEVVGYEDKRIELNTGLNESNVDSSQKQFNIQEKYVMKRLSKMDQQNDSQQNNNLSLIHEELSHEMTNQTQQRLSVRKPFVSPAQNSEKSFNSYELSPQHLTQHMRTPSIFNFDCNALRYEINSNETTFSTFDDSVRPELMLSGYDTVSGDSTVTEHSNGVMASTPVSQMHLSSVEKGFSKRLSSINGPLSPAVPPRRTSLIDIQNVIQNNRKSRKHSILSKDGPTNGPNVTEKRQKKCETLSLDSETSEISANNSNNSKPLRTSRRNRNPVSYKEPPLRSKLRRA